MKPVQKPFFLHRLCLVAATMVPLGASAAESQCKDTDLTSPAPGMITGFGEGEAFAEAKSAAIADAVAVLGTKITATNTYLENTRNAEVKSEVTTETDGFVSGIKVLSNCPGRPVRVKVGIPHALVANMLTHEAEERSHWLLSTIEDLKTSSTPKRRDQAGKAYSEAKNSEKSAFAAWLVIGQLPSSFKKMESNKRQYLEGLLTAKKRPLAPVSIFATDSIARRSLSALLLRLRRDDITATQAPSATGSGPTWSCSLARGTPLGESLPFQVRCILTELELVPTIEARSIADLNSIEDAALRLVVQRLEMP